jgi:hypothetical protein
MLLTRRTVCLFAMTTVVTLAAQSAHAQMNYSVYTDIWQSANGDTVFGYMQVDSIDGGCGGPVLGALTTMYSPSYRDASAQSSAVGLSYGDEDGWWTFVGDFTVYCNCGGHEMPFGGGEQAQLERRPTSLSVASDQYITPESGQLYNRERHYQVRDQFGEPLQRGGMTVTENYSDLQGNCGIGEVTIGQGSTNGSGQFKDNYWLGGSPPNPCTQTATQRHYVNGTQVSTFSVQWTRTSVSIN